MIEMKPIVKIYYDGLEEGKLLGRRCTRCGAVEFPPVLVCNSCSSFDMEWAEVSGKAYMTDFVLASVLSSKPENKDLEPYAYGCVRLEEGAAFNALVLGITKKNKAEIINKLPIPVKAKIVQREKFKTIVFELVKPDNS